MKDIWFDISTREIRMKNNDFSTTDNPSVQNGGIIECGKGINPEQPQLGVGILPGIQGGPVDRFVYEMNRWKAQCIEDGATLAYWNPAGIVGNRAKVKSFISYL